MSEENNGRNVAALIADLLSEADRLQKLFEQTHQKGMAREADLMREAAQALSVRQP